MLSDAIYCLKLSLSLTATKRKLRKTMIKKNIIFLFLLLLTAHAVNAQVTTGKIVYERKTNLYKKFSRWHDVKDWIKEEDKTKVDVFELYFNDSLSLFK